MRVAIIGAGISGLYLAWKLAEKGQNVSVFEKREKIGKEVCSGLFSDRILDFIPPSQRLVQNRINSVLIHFPGKTLKVKFSRKLLVMDHAQLDNLTADLAKKAGAKIFLGEQIKLPPVGTDMIIGCDGANSFVRQSLTDSTPKLYLALQGFISKNTSSDYVETWPTQSGFIWKIPRGGPARNAPATTSKMLAGAGGETEYGIMESPKRAKLIFEEFLKEKNLRLEKISSALVPQGLIIPRNPKIALCGDAAGLTKPWSGGGVIWGLTAANLLLKTFPNFIKYQKEVKTFFLPKIVLAKTAKKIVYFLGFNFPWLLPKNVKIESDFLL